MQHVMKCIFKAPDEWSFRKLKTICDECGAELSDQKAWNIIQMCNKMAILCHIYQGVSILECNL